MVSSLRQCPGTAEKVCSLFLPARDKEPRLLYSSCRGEECNIDDGCGDYYFWDDDMWQKVNKYHAKLALERNAKAASSSSSFSGFTLSMPVPLCNLSFSFDSAVVTSVASIFGLHCNLHVIILDCFHTAFSFS